VRSGILDLAFVVASPDNGHIVSLDDYGVLDRLLGTELTHVDEFLLNLARTHSGKIRFLIRRVEQDPSPDLPPVTDSFYVERLEYLLDSGELVVTRMPRIS
jgi:hypothetical protein